MSSCLRLSVCVVMIGKLLNKEKKMSEITNETLVNEGLQLLENALERFLNITGCNNSSAIASMVNGILILGETVYSSYKK
jgi:hypothetical protein